MEAIIFPDYDPAAPTHKYWNDTSPHIAMYASGRYRRATNAHYALARLNGAPVLPLNSADQYADMASKID